MSSNKDGLILNRVLNSERNDAQLVCSVVGLSQGELLLARAPPSYKWSGRHHCLGKPQRVLQPLTCVYFCVSECVRFGVVVDSAHARVFPCALQ